ncbi:MAG TPA: SWIM zinc finger family protein [Caulobacter sp.]|nr:SWIM zinc finger family protein [Caulobacter sp.]
MHAPAFDYDAITRDMPEARVKRGENYADKGWVSLVECSTAGVLAHVLGEQGIAYVVEVSAPDAADARCTCKDFADTGLRCKHVVATVRTVLDADPETLDDVADRLRRLLDQLEMEERDDADLLVERARRDPALLRELEGEAAADS